jgi:2-polyprenyl-3-methyl-5-hydroxy-6-metoxy-1,4-benzoquinol methylase
MHLLVRGATMSAAYGAPTFLEDSDLDVLDACPVCCDGESQRLISMSKGTDGEGLALSWCASCTHCYLSRRPSVAWFARYYDDEWDTGRHALDAPSIQDRVRRLPGVTGAAAARRAWRDGASVTTRDATIMSMLSALGQPAGLQRGAKVLEVGVGYGYTLALLQRLGFDAYGTEASRRRVDVCRSKGLKVEHTGIDDFDAVARHGPFDIIYSAHVFEHLTDLGRIMGRLSALVSPGGAIYVEVPHGPVAENLLHRTHVPVHTHLFSAQSMTTLLEGHGFGVVRILADMNLHVVARKGVPSTLSAVSVDAQPDQLATGWAALSESSRRAVYEYDHFHVRIRDETDGAVTYDRPPSYAVTPVCEPGTGSLVNRFVLERDGAGSDWPVIFLHDSPRPPAWVKRL